MAEIADEKLEKHFEKILKCYHAIRETPTMQMKLPGDNVAEVLCGRSKICTVCPKKFNEMFNTPAWRKLEENPKKLGDISKADKKYLVDNFYLAAKECLKKLKRVEEIATVYDFITMFLTSNGYKVDEVADPSKIYTIRDNIIKGIKPSLEDLHACWHKQGEVETLWEEEEILEKAQHFDVCTPELFIKNLYVMFTPQDIEKVNLLHNDGVAKFNEMLKAKKSKSENHEKKDGVLLNISRIFNKFAKAVCALDYEAAKGLHESLINFNNVIKL